jgi:hypothetical protein
MDYTDDAAMFMFTRGQSRRIDACLEGARASFLTAPAFALPGALPAAQPAPAAAAPAVAAPPDQAPAPAPAEEPAEEPAESEVVRLRQEVERLRRDYQRAESILDTIRAALKGHDSAPDGG